MEVEVVENKKNRLKVEITNGTHEALKLVEEQVLEEKDVTFASYKREHLLKNKYIFLVQTKNKNAKKVFNKAVKNAAKNVKSLRTKLTKSI